MASGGGIARVTYREVEAAIDRGEITALAPKLKFNGELTAKDAADAANDGDKLARRLILDTGNRLGEAWAILVDLFNPERIVIGGLAMCIGENLLGPGRQSMECEALPASAEACKRVPAVLGEQVGDAVAIGVAMGLQADNARSKVISRAELRHSIE